MVIRESPDSTRTKTLTEKSGEPGLDELTPLRNRGMVQEEKEKGLIYYPIVTKSLSVCVVLGLVSRFAQEEL